MLALFVLKVETMQDLGELLGYDSEPCPNCGRVRVMAYSGGKHICQKCDWCIEDEGYFDWDRYDDEVTFADYCSLFGKGD